MAAFIYRRRVQFVDTDMAGIVHFSVFFRYMEEAEAAMWRDAGLSLADAPSNLGFPRVAASCDYVSPLRYGDEVDIEVTVEKLGPRSIRYLCELSREGTRIATGSMTCVAAEPGANGPKSSNLPARVVEGLSAYRTASGGLKPAAP